MTINNNDFDNYYTQIHEPAEWGSRRIYSSEEVVQYMRACAIEKKARCPIGTVMDKIIERADRNLERLRRGHEVKIPVYYHARRTTTVVNNILGGSIRANKSKEGPGVYISSHLEPQYGGYVFALAREDVECRELSRESSVNKSRIWEDSHSGKAVWRALKDDFPMFVNGKINAVYLVMRNPENSSEIQSSNLEIVSYEEAVEEQQMISDLQGIYESKKWSKNWEYTLPRMAMRVQNLRNSRENTQFSWSA